MPITRGFVGRRRPERDGLPPGQYDIGADFPVLTAEVTPKVDVDRWTVTLDGLVETPSTWTYADLQQLPPSHNPMLPLRQLPGPPTPLLVARIRH